MVNGVAHGPKPGTTLCQLHMRFFKDGDELYLEPWRARAFPHRERPGRGPQRVRPHHRGRRFHFGRDRQRARRQRHPGAQGSCRPLDGRGRVHRLRRLRRHVPECFGIAVPGSQDFAPRPAAARPARALRTRRGDGGASQSGTLRSLHQYRRMRGRLSEGNQAGSNRSNEPRFPDGEAGRAGNGGSLSTGHPRPWWGML